MYWDLDKAVKELHRRQNDEKLMRKLNDFLGWDLCPIPQRQSGILARHVPTARFEDIFFVRKCKEKELSITFPIYPKDEFCADNPSKLRLVKILVYEGRGRNGGPRLKKIYIVNPGEISRLNGLLISEIKTSWGESLVDFHYRTRKVVGIGGEVIDISSWLKSIGPAREYYKYFLAACSIRGILFESFESPGFPHLDVFKRRVVIPAWEFVIKKFGVQPLIVYHPSETSSLREEEINWWYPSEILKAIPKEYQR